MLSRFPGFASEELRELLPGILPEAGGWKRVILELLAAVDQGLVDADGAVDLFAIEGRLDAVALALLRAAAVDDTLLQSEMTSPQQTLAHLVSRFQSRQIEVQEQELRRRMHMRLRLTNGPWRARSLSRPPPPLSLLVHRRTTPRRARARVQSGSLIGQRMDRERNHRERDEKERRRNRSCVEEVSELN